MAEEEQKKVAETTTTAEPSLEPKPETAALAEVTPGEKSVSPVTPPAEKKPDKSEALVPVKNTTEEHEGEKKEGSAGRDAVLGRIATEKRMSLIKAWEEAERSKAENKAQKKISAIGSWENSKKASVEAELKKIEEQLEKKKAEYAEKMKNKIAQIHKDAEEKRAMIEAKRGEDILKAEEMAAKYRAIGIGPKKLLGCF